MRTSDRMFWQIRWLNYLARDASGSTIPPWMEWLILATTGVAVCLGLYAIYCAVIEPLWFEWQRWCYERRRRRD